MKTSMSGSKLWASLAFLTAHMINSASAAPQTFSSNFTRRDDLPPVPPKYDQDKDTFNRFVSKRCSVDQLASEAYGWAEAGVLATAMSGWKPASDYQNAFDVYLGTDSSSTKGWTWTYRQRVQNTVNAQKGIHDGTKNNGNGWWYGYNTFVYCDEDESPWDDICGNVDEGVQAYTWFYEYPRIVGEVFLYVVLCPDAYFKEPNLSDQLRDIKKDRSKAAWLDNLVDSKGHTWFHETFHWPWLITDPQATDSDPDDKDDRVYGPKNVKAKALEKNTYANSVIADAYAVTGLALMMMQTFGLRDPPQPKPGLNSNKIWSQGMGKAPDNWIEAKGMPADNSSSPDLNLWQKPAKANINMDDYSIMLPPTPSSPKCGDHGYTAPYADVSSCQDALNLKRGKDCCTPPEGACINVATSGNIAVDLCSEKNKGICVDCGSVADYVGGMAKNCQKDGKVGGTQDIVEAPGLTVQI